jgi:shikimate kinase
MILKLKRTPGIYLVGFMGSGKSTVARYVADEIGWHFADLDEDIEHEQRASITHLFGTLGEDAFREIEHDALLRRVRRIQSGYPTVLALGGGTFTRPENIELANNNGVSIWIDATFELVRKRVGASTHRPLARDPQRFEALYNARRQLYSRADYRIAVSEDDSRAVATAVLELRLFHE